MVSNEFSRAPGTTSKPPATPGGLTQSHSSPNMNPLLGQGDGTWSSRLGDSGWPDPSNSDSTDGKDWQPGGAAYTDLVPEFEPGKPWKVIHFQYRQLLLLLSLCNFLVECDKIVFIRVYLEKYARFIDTYNKSSVLVFKAYPGPPIFHFILGYPDKKHRG